MDNKKFVLISGIGIVSALVVLAMQNVVKALTKSILDSAE